MESKAMTFRSIAHRLAEEVRAANPDLLVRVDDVDGTDPGVAVSTNIHVFQGQKALAHAFVFEKGALELMAPFKEGPECRYFESGSELDVERTLTTYLKDAELL